MRVSSHCEGCAEAGAVLRDGGDVVAGAPHLGQHLVQPLQGAVQVDLYPARGRGHVLKFSSF